MAYENPEGYENIEVFTSAQELIDSTPSYLLLELNLEDFPYWMKK